MSDKRFKITLFALGITVGVLVGAVLVYFSFAGKKSDKSINEDNLVNKISNNVLGFLSNKEKEAKRDSAEKGKSLLRDVTFIQNKSSEDDEEADEKTIYKIDSTEETIEVKKDELIKILTLDIEKKTIDNTTKTDSILNNLAGVKNKKIVTKMLVEFWQSPINYKGYQMTKNKLVVFGLNPDEAKKMLMQNDKTYLIYSDWAYKLDFNTDFKSLEKANLN
ncbi:MAG: hypothetical protein V4667_12290 [Bacteroidota bacterium]